MKLKEVLQKLQQSAVVHKCAAEVERLTRELYDLHNKFKNLITENTRLCKEIKSLTVSLQIQEVGLELVSINGARKAPLCMQEAG